MSLHVLAWAGAGTKEAGTAGIDWLPWFPEATPTHGPYAEIMPGVTQLRGDRLVQYVPMLADLGVEVRPISWPGGTTLEERYELTQEALDWADAAVWWPWAYVWICADCSFLSTFDVFAEAHWKDGHRVFPSDLEVRALWSEAVRRKDVGLVIDADDGWPELPTWWAPEQFRAGLPDPHRNADLLTVSTPVLERFALSQNANVRVVRNSLDATAFVPDQPRPDGKTRLLWYGLHTRERDYTGFPVSPGVKTYCRAGVQDWHHLLRTLYVGAHPHDPTAAARMRATGFDEVHPFIGRDEWPRGLANAWPEIGVAPLQVNAFNASKSEQHWMEFGACGVPTVAEHFRLGGPYDVIRDGVDGFLAHGRQEWSDAIGRLARSPQLRADIGGAARERVIAEYDPRPRAVELADAFRWAAEHPGIGRTADGFRGHKDGHLRA